MASLNFVFLKTVCHVRDVTILLTVLKNSQKAEQANFVKAMSTSERNLRHPSDWPWGVVFTLWKLRLFHKRTKKLTLALFWQLLNNYYLCLTTFIFKIINILCENLDCHWNKWHLQFHISLPCVGQTGTSYVKWMPVVTISKNYTVVRHSNTPYVTIGSLTVFNSNCLVLVLS